MRDALFRIIGRYPGTACASSLFVLGLLTRWGEPILEIVLAFIFLSIIDPFRSLTGIPTPRFDRIGMIAGGGFLAVAVWLQGQSVPGEKPIISLGLFLGTVVVFFLVKTRIMKTDENLVRRIDWNGRRPASKWCDGERRYWQRIYPPYMSMVYRRRMDGKQLTAEFMIKDNIVAQARSVALLSAIAFGLVFGAILSFADLLLSDSAVALLVSVSVVGFAVYEEGMRRTMQRQRAVKSGDLVRSLASSVVPAELTQMVTSEARAGLRVILSMTVVAVGVFISAMLAAFLASGHIGSWSNLPASWYYTVATFGGVLACVALAFSGAKVLSLHVRSVWPNPGAIAEVTLSRRVEDFAILGVIGFLVFLFVFLRFPDAPDWLSGGLGVVAGMSGVMSVLPFGLRKAVISPSRAHKIRTYLLVELVAFPVALEGAEMVLLDVYLIVGVLFLFCVLMMLAVAYLRLPRYAVEKRLEYLHSLLRGVYLMPGAIVLLSLMDVLLMFSGTLIHQTWPEFIIRTVAIVGVLVGLSGVLIHMGRGFIDKTQCEIRDPAANLPKAIGCDGPFSLEKSEGS